MMQKVKSAAELRQEINAVIHPLTLRSEHYRAARLSMRKKIIESFLTKKDEARILEVMRFVTKDSVEAAVNNQLLFIDFNSVDEFTQSILSCGLGFAFDKDFFIFPYSNKSERTLNADTIVFIKQFAHVLNAYRTCYCMETIYNVILNHPYVQIQAYEQYRQEIEAIFNDESNDKVDLNTFLYEAYAKVVAIQQKLNNQYDDINTMKDSFIEATQGSVAVIGELLRQTGTRLINAVSEFSDNSWFGTYWKPLVQDLIHQLFAGNYHHSWKLFGALSINTNYFATLATELAHFSLTMQDQMAPLKLALLSEASSAANNLMQKIKSQAALNNIILTEPKQQSDHHQGSSQLMFYTKAIKAFGHGYSDESESLRNQF